MNLTCIVCFTLLLLLRLARREAKKSFFQEPAIDFLRMYGHHYNLFQRFYPNTTCTPPAGSKTTDIQEDYETRDYSRFREWEAVGTLRNYTQHFYREDLSLALEIYNNQFRYGTAPYDRFLDVFLSDTLGSVFFSSFESNMKPDAYGCNFLLPSPAFSAASVERGFKNAIKQAVQHTHITCPLPADIAKAVAADPTLEVRLQFVRGTAAQHEALISDILVRRAHPMDRRAFNISLSTQVDDWNEPMFVEWLVYHILLGVEHFYLFDITRAPWAVKGSAVEPFLLANIVSIYHFPFVPVSKDDNPFPASYPHGAYGVHTVELNIAMHRFGPYSLYLGFQDLDEFFCPSEDLLPRGDRWGHVNPLYQALAQLNGLSPEIPGIMFDTLEMGCADAENFHHSKSPRRPALTTTCTITGHYFEELKVSPPSPFPHTESQSLSLFNQCLPFPSDRPRQDVHQTRALRRRYQVRGLAAPPGPLRRHLDQAHARGAFLPLQPISLQPQRPLRERSLYHFVELH